MSTWSLKLNGTTTKTLAEWVVTADISQQLNSLASSQISFFAAADYNSTPPFAYDDSIEILEDATVWFAGKITDITPSLVGVQEGFQYIVSDAWDELERICFKQSFEYFIGWIGGDPANGPDLGTQQIENLVLNQSPTGIYQGTRAQLKETLDWAIAEGVSLQYVEGNLPNITPPPRAERNIWCADAIRRELGYMDAVSWFDYTTSPPTLNIKRRQDMTPVSIDLSAYSKAAVSLRPLHRRKVPYVKITYEKQIITNGSSFLQTYVDQYPVSLPAEKRNPLSVTIPLRARTIEQISQPLEVAAIDVTSLAFWKLVKPELKDTDRYRNLAIVSGTASRQGSLANLITKGAIADWMGGTEQEDSFEVEIEYTQGVKVSGTTVDGSVVKREKVSVSKWTTDLSTNTYQNTNVTDPGEDPSAYAGLAEELYNDLSVLNFEGTIDLVGDEMPTPASIGDTINLTNGRTEWATMAALVQGVTRDIHTGAVTITVGANKLLSAADLVAYMRHNRNHTWSLSIRSGASVPGGTVTLPSATPKENTTTGAPEHSEHVVHDQTDGYRVVSKSVDTAAGSQPSLRIVKINTSGTEVAVGATVAKILLEFSEALGYEIKLRWYSACQTDGTEGYIIALGSPFIPTLPPGKTDELEA